MSDTNAALDRIASASPPAPRRSYVVYSLDALNRALIAKLEQALE